MSDNCMIETTVGFIDAVRKEIELKLPSEGYFMTFEVLATGVPYNVSIECCEHAILAAVLAEPELEGHQVFPGAVSWMNDVLKHIGAPPKYLSDVVQYMIQTCKTIHFIRYGKCYAITDGEIEVVFDNDEPPVSLPKH